MSPNHEELNVVAKMFDSGMDVDLEKLQPETHVVCGLLKKVHSRNIELMILVLEGNPSDFDIRVLHVLHSHQWAHAQNESRRFHGRNQD